jgi:dihydropteroate synthase
LIQEIIERALISRLDHAAYLGREIEKAMIALKYNLKYSQDEDLLINK